MGVIAAIYSHREDAPALALPLYASAVEAGFPSPADDYLEKELDLHELMVDHPIATYYLRIRGDSMREAGIFDGDIVVVDRSLEPRDQDIVIAALDGELTIKRLLRRDGRVLLKAENKNYPALAIAPERDFLVWGVVTGCVRRFQR